MSSPVRKNLFSVVENSECSQKRWRLVLVVAWGGIVVLDLFGHGPAHHFPPHSLCFVM